MVRIGSVAAWSIFVVGGVVVAVMSFLTLCAWLFTLHLVMAGISLLKQDGVYLDAVTAPLLALVAIYRILVDERHVIIPLLYIVWGVRLGAFVWYRRRLLGLKDAKCLITDLASLFSLCIVRFLWCISMVATLYVVPHRSKVVRIELGLLALACVAVQHMADCQLTLWRFRHKKDQYRDGLFAYSQHPNLLAELGFHLFTGLAVSPHSLFGFIAFLISVLMICFIPTNTLTTRRQRAHERWGHQASFQTYTDATPRLMTFHTPFRLLKETALSYYLARTGTSRELWETCTFLYSPMSEQHEQIPAKDVDAPDAV